MPDISQEISQIRNAVFGEEVRGSIIGGLEKVNDDNESYNPVKQQLVAVNELLNNSEGIVQNVTDATSEANAAANTLQYTSNMANAVKGELDQSIATANTTKGQLTSANTVANTTLNNLRDVIAEGNTADTNLKKSTANAVAIKNNLDSIASGAHTVEQLVASLDDKYKYVKYTVAPSSLQDLVQKAFVAYSNNGFAPVSFKAPITIVGGTGDVPSDVPSGWVCGFFYFQNNPGNGEYNHIGTILAWSATSDLFTGYVTQPTTASNYDDLSIEWTRYAKTEELIAKVSEIRNSNGDVLTSHEAAVSQQSCPASGAIHTTNFYDTIKDSKSYIGSICDNSDDWYSVISARHRNGSGGDGGKFGLVLYSYLTKDDALSFRHQLNGTWGDARVLLDTTNFSDYAPTKTQMNSLLSTVTSSTANISIGAGAGVKQTLTFTIPAGWKYISTVGTWPVGAAIPTFAVDSKPTGITGSISLSVWGVNYMAKAVTCKIFAKILLQRIF